jgi:hypothetical protein
VSFPELETLQCSDNKLIDLDIKNCPNLDLLDCRNNKLGNLDGLKDAFISLSELDIDGNPLTNFTLPKEKLDELNPEVKKELMKYIVTTTSIETIDPIKLSSEDKGFDPIMFDEQSIRFYLSDDKNNIVFKFSDNYLFSSKKSIKTTIEDGSAIFYECYVVNTLKPTNVNKKSPLYNLRKIGLSINYVLLDQINEIIKDTKSSQTVYVIQITEKQLASVVSKSYYDTLDAVSRAHCQEGQGDILYNIVKEPINWVETGGKRKTKKRKLRRKRRRQSKKMH